MGGIFPAQLQPGFTQSEEPTGRVSPAASPQNSPLGHHRQVLLLHKAQGKQGERDSQAEKSDLFQVEKPTPSQALGT